MELKFLGRGSAFNTKEGNTSAYIKDNGTLFLIDCGSNIFERIIDKHLLDDVDNVYVAITHRHPDHVGSFGDLIFYCYYVKNTKVTIVSEDQWTKDCLLFNGVTLDLYDICNEVTIHDLGLFVYLEEAEHCGMICNYQNIFPSYSVILKLSESKTIFYSGDTNLIDFDAHDFEDEYYIECCIADYSNNVHYNINKLYNDCNKNNISVNKVWCMHFDSDEAIKRAKELGFNVVTVE